MNQQLSLYQIEVRNEEAFLLTQWLERGVFEAMEKGYLKSLSFGIFARDPRTNADTLLETYQFFVEYPASSNDPVMLNGQRVTREGLKQQAVIFLRSLIEFSATLEVLPQERWLTLKLTVSTTP